MTKDEKDKLEILKLITSAEHHFNNLCFNIRALASTWILATFAGVGWILKDLPTNAETTGVMIDKVDLLLALCVGSSVGIFVLWILDVRIYQQMTNVWFENRKKYETDDVFPSIRIDMKNLFETGRATELIMFYYLALTAAPLLLAIFIARSACEADTVWLIGAFLFLVTFVIFIFTPKDKEWMEEKLKEESRVGIIHPDEQSEFMTDEKCHVLEVWNIEEDSDVSISRARVEPGMKTQKHSLSVDEKYIITSGFGNMYVGGGGPDLVTVGDLIVIPAGQTQWIENTDSEDLVFYCICTPRFIPASYKAKE